MKQGTQLAEPYAQRYSPACIKQMTEMSNADVIGSTDIEYDTTEEVE